jgi:hypothetical protein
LKYLEKCGWRLATGGWLFEPRFYLEDQNGEWRLKKGEGNPKNGHKNILLILAVKPVASR